MIGSLYDIGISAYILGIKLASAFHPKAKQWIAGRKNVLQEIGKQRKGVASSPIIFHCASLGEFEQAVPVMDAYHQKYPNDIIWVSFFSPSGYQHAKIPSYVDYYFYLPADTKSNATKFICNAKPKAIVSIKYEIWPQLIAACGQEKIPFILLAANFRSNQIYFKPWGTFFRKALRDITVIGTQFKSSVALVSSINPKCTWMGDTRFDRVIQTANEAWTDDYIKGFCADKKALIFGSCWEPELEILKESYQDIEGKIILAPHRIDHTFIKYIEELFPNESCRYGEEFIGKRILIVNKIGLLKHLYRYGHTAFIGGGFSNKLHNILEPAAYGIPCLFGNKHGKYPEAQLLVEEEAAFDIENGKQFVEIVHSKELLEKAGKNALSLIQSHKNASKRALTIVEEALA